MARRNCHQEGHTGTRVAALKGNNEVNIFKKEVWCLFGSLLFFAFKVSNAFDGDCDFYQEIPIGNTFFIRNPNYPSKYTGGRSCRWHATSNTRIRLNCNVFNLPASANCAQDSFNIYTDENSGPRRLCGNGNFTKESIGNTMVITLTTAYNTRGGIFSCSVQAIEDQQCRCGWKKPTKIVGGVETGINEYPMMAAIIDIKRKIVHCGGTIISAKHILTAAHCLVNQVAENLGVLIGDHAISQNTDTSAAKLFKVSYFSLYPLYSTKSKDYDIAIVYIVGLITFTNEIGPACLPFFHSRDSFGGLPVDLLGWGTTEFGGEVSDTLQMATVRVTNYYDCKNFYPQHNEYRQICTFAQGKDACQFDSGGPVLWQNPNTRRVVLVGIISFGSVCADEKPAVNTRVGFYIDWILENTPGTVFCEAE